MRYVYLDNAATSPVRPEVVEAIARSYVEVQGNASSLHTSGQRAKRALEDARKMVAKTLGASPSEIYFTPGGTASDNLAIKGVARARDVGHIITTAIEHHAVLAACHHLETQGYRITYLPVDKYGLVDPDAVARSLRDDTILVSVMLANNEVGTIEPLSQISAIAHERGALVHTDAVQAVGKMPVNVNDLGVDLLSLTAHKFYGPKGCGALYVRRGTPIEPLLHGGHQERELSPGTENIAGVVGLAKALELAYQDEPEEWERIGSLRDVLEAGIRERIEGVHLNGHPELRIPNVLNLSFDRAEGESLLLALDTRGIAVSTGSACSAGSTDPSHVLMAMGIGRQRAEGSLRFSLGRENDLADVEYTLDALVAVVEGLRQLSPL